MKPSLRAPAHGFAATLLAVLYISALAFASFVPSSVTAPSFLSGGICSRSFDGAAARVRMADNSNGEVGVTPETTLSTAATTDLEDGLKSLYGGDLAGLSATFSSSTGELIRVPEHLVPESLIEWGQVPSCLEVLVSEDLTTYEDDDGKTSGKTRLERKSAAVMPEVGCGVDNLDTMRSSDTFNLSAMGGPGLTGDGQGTAAVFAGGSVTSIDSYLPPLRESARQRVETVFSISPETEEGVEYARRIRVSFDVIPKERRISSPITMIVERRTSEVSSKGTIGLGGGLDGRTVSRLVGRDNFNRPFAEDDPDVDIEKLRGNWNQLNSENTNDPIFKAHGEALHTIILPRNVVVQYGSETCEDEKMVPWEVAVALVSQQVNETKLERVVVHRSFGPELDCVKCINERED